MKFMRVIGLVVLLFLYHVGVHAEDSLMYAGSGSDVDGSGNNRVQRGTTSLTPVNQNTNYGGEYPIMEENIRHTPVSCNRHTDKRVHFISLLMITPAMVLRWRGNRVRI